MSVVLEKAYKSLTSYNEIAALSFALQNIQAFFNNEVTNVNICTKHKPNFTLRKFTSFMNKFEVVSLFRSSGKYLSTCSCFYILYRHCLSNIGYYLILKTNYLADQNHNFEEFRLACICCCCSCAYLHSVSVLKYLRCVNIVSSF